MDNSLNEYLKQIEVIFNATVVNMIKIVERKTVTDEEKDEMLFNLDRKQVENGEITNFDNIQKMPGIYIFYGEVEKFAILKTNKIFELFNKVKYGSRIYKNGKVMIDGECIGNHCFYVGKSLELSVRLTDHKNDSESNTYSLKMKHVDRKEIFNCDLYIFSLKKDYLDYSNTILSAVETKLHEKLTPIIGSSRV